MGPAPTANAMRLGLIILGAALFLGITRSAAADSHRVDTSWAAPAVRVALLDGYHKANTPLAQLARHAEGGDSKASDREPDPGQALSQAVERMWSQVRAYRRPGGAELIIRGRF